MKTKVVSLQPQELLNRFDSAKTVCVDVETSGLDWKRNHICGYVLAFGPSPDDSYYVPVRHRESGNVSAIPGPSTATGWDGKTHWVEDEIIKRLERQNLLVFGHNLAFDLKFLWRVGLTRLEASFEDTIINAPLLNEYSQKFSLEYLCNAAGVAAKKSAQIVEHIRKFRPEATDRNAMGHFWELSGDDAVAVDYATGDGTSTWQLRDWQNRRIEAEELTTVHRVESRLVPILARMTCRGIRVNEERLHWVARHLADEAERLSSIFPKDFNVRSPQDVQRWCEQHGKTDWPLTPKLGKPSFPEGWLKTHPPGQQIVAVRKIETLKSSFIDPMINEHLWNGRVHSDFNQLRGDEFGTITGRLSSSNPNLQQISKHDEEMGRLHRSIFVSDEGKTWASVDYSQCLVAGTKVMVPGGTKNIETIKPGDLVYSYDNSRNLVIRKVTWAGQTGVRNVCRVKWATNGRTYGHLDLTADHKIRLIDGSYKSVEDITSNLKQTKKRQHPYFVRVMALRRSVVVNKKRNEERNFLWPTGTTKFKESRLVFEQINGWSPEHVHHIDGNKLNDLPGNLEGMTANEHRSAHDVYGMQKLTPSQRKDRSLIATRALQKKFKLINNHFITHIIPLPDPVPVYDITVEDTHNFIANEICVHNCEPRLLAFYSRSRALIEGYTANPPVDAHTAVSAAMNKNWPNMTKEERKQYRDVIGKRINQTLITGGGKGVLVKKYGMDPNEVNEAWNNYFRAMPEIKTLQKKAASVFRQRGYILSLLGRRARLRDPDKDYTAVNRLLQCGNADILKAKMVEIDAYLASENRPIDVLNNVHDSLDYQFDEAYRKVYAECLRIMTDFSSGLIEIDIPMAVDAGEGRNWAEATWGPE